MIRQANFPGIPLSKKEREELDQRLERIGQWMLLFWTACRQGKRGTRWLKRIAAEGLAMASDELHEIHRKRLYREDGPFEEFCEKHLSLTGQHASQLLQQGEIRQQIRTDIAQPRRAQTARNSFGALPGLELPETADQTQALAKIPREHRAKIWCQTCLDVILKN